MRQEDNTASTAIKDLLFVLLLIMLLIPHLKKTEDDSRPPGRIMVEMQWASGVNTDVDLWVRGPDREAVGYSNRSSETFNLLRDDLGMINDMLDLNYENSFSRGSPDGDYVVNIHLYSNAAGVMPVPVRVTVGIRTGGKTEHILTRDMVLVQHGQELTVGRFSLQDNVVVAGSIHDLPVLLASQADP